MTTNENFDDFDEIVPAISSRDDLTYQVQRVLDNCVGVFDTEGVVDDIMAAHGLVHLDTVDGNEFWLIVEDHDLGE